MFKTLFSERYLPGELTITFLKGMMVSFPLCVLLFTAQEFGWFGMGPAFFEQIASSIIFSISLEWSCYIFIITLYYKSRQMVTSMDGIIVTTFFGLGAIISYVIANLFFWNVVFNPSVTLLLVIGQLFSSITLGFFIGQSKAKFDSDEVGSWKVRIQGLSATVLIMAVFYFCTCYVDTPWVGFIAFPTMLLSATATFFMLRRAFKQFSRYMSIKKRSEKNTQAFYPRMAGGEIA